MNKSIIKHAHNLSMHVVTTTCTSPTAPTRHRSLIYIKQTNKQLQPKRVNNYSRNKYVFIRCRIYTCLIGNGGEKNVSFVTISINSIANSKGHVASKHHVRSGILW